MSNKPWEQWYWKDWLSDTELQSASPSTRGIWVNLLGRMWQMEASELKLSTAQFCRLAGCTEDELKQFLEEAQALGFCYASRQSNSDITVTSRRRQRQEKARKNNAERQRRYYQKHKPNAHSDATDPDPDPDPEEKKKITPPYSPPPSDQSPKAKKAPQRAAFRPPDLSEVMAYCDERGNGVDAEAWMDHYTSNGWRVGRNPMKDWKAAVRTWERNNGSNGYGRRETAVERTRREQQEWLERRQADEVLASDGGDLRATVGEGVRVDDGCRVGGRTFEHDS